MEAAPLLRPPKKNMTDFGSCRPGLLNVGSTHNILLQERPHQIPPISSSRSQTESESMSVMSARMQDRSCFVTTSIVKVAIIEIKFNLIEMFSNRQNKIHADGFLYLTWSILLTEHGSQCLKQQQQKKTSSIYLSII